jgi:hypothetical protein
VAVLSSSGLEGVTTEDSVHLEIEIQYSKVTVVRMPMPIKFEDTMSPLALSRNEVINACSRVRPHGLNPCTISSSMEYGKQSKNPARVLS